MKRLFIVSLVALSLASCSTVKEAASTATSTTTSTASSTSTTVSEAETTLLSKISDASAVLKGGTGGMVRYSTNDCGLYILVYKSGKVYKYYPENIADEYKVNNATVAFTFTESSSSQPTGCSFDKVITISAMKKFTK